MFSFQKKKSRENSVLSWINAILLVIIIRSVVFSPYRIPTGSMIPTLLVGDHIVVTKFNYGLCRFSFLFSQWIDYFSGRVAVLDRPKRGDIVVFTCPKNFSMDYVKRLVGLPGDKVQMKEGMLYINGVVCPVKKLSEGYKAYDGESFVEGDVYTREFPVARLDKQGKVHESGKKIFHKMLKLKPFGAARYDNTKEFLVPENHYFFQGDNQDGSGDSRGEDLGYVYADYLLGPAEIVFFSLGDKFTLVKPWTWWSLRLERIGTWVR
ncbi:signal peptidase I [Holospora curviuscula]|uniref:Signal peptidase I n=1 Tax=Holospora curviuscula TaxID=1082868 RepID=A0A2S5R8R7_9PROT|nr:signal peptidase I [Holospora curviuscula]PPE03729.1 Signal peptidase I [Holospora curviuscula]